jgi:hypothetical protein
VPERPDDDTLRLLREVLEEIGTNEAVQAGGSLFSMTIELDAERNFARTTLREPRARYLRHLLDLLRHLDMPSSDITLDRVLPIVERLPLGVEWRTELEVAKREYQLAQQVREIRVQHPTSRASRIPRRTRHGSRPARLLAFGPMAA